MDTLYTFMIFLLFLVPVAVAQFSERQRLRSYALPASPDPAPTQRMPSQPLDLALRYAPHALLITINLGLMLLAGLAVLNEVATALVPELVEPDTPDVNWLGVALVCALTAGLAFLVLVPHLRRWLARWLPIDPDSIVHTTALAFAIYQIGLSLGQMALIGDLENLIDVELTLTIWDVILNGLPLALFALVGVGWLIRRPGRGTLDRLGLRRPTGRQILLALGLTALLLAFDFAVNLTWETVDPAGYDLLNRVTENIFGGLLTVGGALALGLSAGIGEELLFRGAVQPRLGIGLASVLFAIGHLQYGLTVATLEVFLIGLVLGLVRDRTNTTLCILIHASYNTVGTFLGMLQP